ncbi:hypothetical protein A2215_00320 [Candidatus Berkelbacteria bacterium RIFOXYA2_FULL_43_10]|uniref:Peptidase C39-like domain-containing protein n=1 Tax=Candidatus Berkelbacteria bacterium RIFOXYA2_FULL_43_10 TaxID=1797472 RepID=A0A1F5EC64_9BACT|nr:MAG: hypothetical protein A2215_00320 [Candidatus Berkelbacteria bacterium RIFOXYA2_FULL_43_10]
MVPVIVAVAVAVIVLVVATGVALGLTISEIRKRTGETPIANGEGRICGGATAPETTLQLSVGGKKYDIPKRGTQGSGLIVAEDHLVTSSESVRPTSNKQEIDNHLKVTGFEKNCPSGSPECQKSIQVWTPSAGGGTMGGGNLGVAQVPPEHEPWIMNAPWRTDGDGALTNPPPGTRVVITSKKTGKSIVAVAGYEWGPEERYRWAIGAQHEVLAQIDASTDSEISYGFAVNQSLTPGTVYGVDCNSDTQSGSCGNVPLYRQCSSPWGDDSYGRRSAGVATICSSGCGPTSLAMVLKFNGINITPAETALYSLNNGHRINYEGTNSSLFSAMAKKHNLKFEALDWDSAKEILNQKKPLLVGVRGEPFSSGGHYIVLTCLTNNTVSINDPGPRKLTSSTIDEIQQGVARGGQGAYYYIHP